MTGQLPEGDEVFLDHIAHFVPDIAAATAALQRCGFQTTPFSVQVAPSGKDGALEPTGTGNVTAMLKEGYLEVLCKTSDTPLSRELEAAIGRWPGVHLAAFSVAEPYEAHARLEAEGFPMRPIVRLRRPVETEDGIGEARFTVVRPEAGALPEGRVQMLTHHTEREVWQPRWLAHPNGATALLGLLIVSDEVTEAVARFQKFLLTAPQYADFGPRLELPRGHVQISDARRAAGLLGEAPGLPWMAAYALLVDDLSRVETFLAAAGCESHAAGNALVTAFPAALGSGFWAFVEDQSDVPWL
ncbi:MULTISPECIES: VOC family protein [Rhodomicrobium]|uniref:VOC family protein n=1 Tax=Rhodomicrobium TaxID=1068 RepID=UPI000B4A7D08|nr:MULTISPECIES: VOC family protein [Rhodomicrobium]